MAVDPNAAAIEQQAASGTGLPLSVVHQQAVAESGEQDRATSSAGAQGFWQFLPSTYNALAGQAGVPQGSWNNVADETKVYIVYMRQLLSQEGGSIFKALEAYNAGPGNLGAGAGYASGIMSKAGVDQSTKAGGAQTADLTGLNIPNPLNIPGDIANGVVGALGGAASGIVKGFLESLGVPSLKDMFQRMALIIFGAVLVFVGIRILSQGSSNSGKKQSTVMQPTNSEPKAAAKEAPKTEVLSGGGEESLGSSEAIDAAVAA